MRGIGTDEKMIIKMLITHDSLQREEIERKYKAMYGELVGSDAQTLTEILYFGLSLEDAIDLNLSSDFRRLISSLACCDRDPEENEVDEEIVKDDAQKLYDAGIGKNFGTDEDVFVHILNNRSYSHLLRLFDVYEDFSGEPIETSIDSEFSGDVKEGLLSIVKRVRDPSGFFAERLNMSMRGSGTDDKTLIRIIVTRSEEDLENIKQRYMEMYGSSLVKDIKSDTGGDYQKLLCAILTANEEESA
ncbi:Annexin A11 [Armadillidium vulgare]|nr:Annexin A11 [Armadillidium vulgare]